MGDILKDALLTDEQIVENWNVTGSAGCFVYPKDRNLAKAQHAATLRAVLRWFNSPCDNPEHKKYKELRWYCSQCWHDFALAAEEVQG